MRKKQKPTGSYEVGYGKPPQHTQFKKGESGNRRGRRNGVPHFSTDLIQVLNQRLVITENGQRRSLTKGETILTQLVNTAVSGQVQSLALYLEDLLDLEARLEAKATSERARHRTEAELCAEMDRILGLTPGEYGSISWCNGYPLSRPAEENGDDPGQGRTGKKGGV